MLRACVRWEDAGARPALRRGTAQGRARTCMLVTAPVFQAARGWLKAEAEANMDCGDGRLVAVRVARVECVRGGWAQLGGTGWRHVVATAALSPVGLGLG